MKILGKHTLTTILVARCKVYENKLFKAPEISLHSTYLHRTKQAMWHL